MSMKLVSRIDTLTKLLKTLTSYELGLWYTCPDTGVFKYDNRVTTMSIVEYSVNHTYVEWLKDALEDTGSDYWLVGHTGKQAIVLKRGDYNNNDAYDVILAEVV